MSCGFCKYGPKPCERWKVEGHLMLCQESIEVHIGPAPISNPNMKKLENEVNNQINKLYEQHV